MFDLRESAQVGSRSGRLKRRLRPTVGGVPATWTYGNQYGLFGLFRMHGERAGKLTCPAMSSKQNCLQGNEVFYLSEAAFPCA